MHVRATKRMMSTSEAFLRVQKSVSEEYYIQVLKQDPGQLAERFVPKISHLRQIHPVLVANPSTLGIRHCYRRSSSTLRIHWKPLHPSTLSENLYCSVHILIGVTKDLQIRPHTGSDFTPDDPFRPQKKTDLGHFGTQTRPH